MIGNDQTLEVFENLRSELGGQGGEVSMCVKKMAEFFFKRIS